MRERITPRRIEPRPGQESVWDYPRPPRVERSSRRVVIRVDGHPVAESTRALRVLETAGAPVYYLPPEDIEPGILRPSGGRTTVCEWKGRAEYHDLVIGEHVIERAAWVYPDPAPGYEAIAGHVAFYPAKVEATLDGEVVTPQAGGFYGGWVTSDIVGPIKGEPGSEHW